MAFNFPIIKCKSFIFVLILIALLLRLPILAVEEINSDEFEHLHAARCISKGMIPYQDYYDNHTPLVHFILSPFFIFLGDNMLIIFFARFIMLIFACGILFLTYKLGQRLYNRNIALYSVLFLSYVLIFYNKTIDIRPDGASVFFWMSALIFFISGIQQKKQLVNKSKLHFFLSGIFIAVAILFTQKALIAVIGLILSFIWIGFDKRLEFSLKETIISFLYFIVGVIIPCSILYLYLLLNGALYDFIYTNFIMNIRWPYFRPSSTIKLMLKQNPFFSILSLMGLVIAIYRLRRKKSVLKCGFVPMLSTCVFIAGLSRIPPYEQYFLLFLPFLAIYCGFMFNLLMKYFSWRKIQKFLYKQKYFSIAFITSGLIAAFALFIYILIYAKISVLTPPKMLVFYIWMWIVIIVLSVWHLVKNIGKEFIIIVLLFGIIIYPLDQMLSKFMKIDCLRDNKKNVIRFERRNQDQLNKIRFILENTAPDDTVLYGWSGLGAFRNHVFYYGIMNEAVQKLVGQRKFSEDVLKALYNKKPKVIVYDNDIKALSSDVNSFIKKNYKSTRFDDIYILK